MLAQTAHLPVAHFLLAWLVALVLGGPAVLAVFVWRPQAAKLGGATLVGTGVVFLASFFTFDLGWLDSYNTGGVWDSIELALMFLVPGVVLGLGPIIAVRRDRRVRRGNGATCSHCGYSLQGLPEPRCPECGWRADAAEEISPSGSGGLPAEDALRR